MHLDIVTPERRLASIEASAVVIPGADGDMTAMADHAPTIATLRAGLLKVTHAGGTDEYLVSGGFAEVNGASVSVLAEEAAPRAEVDAQMIGRLLEAAEAEAAQARESGNLVDETAKAVADVAELGRELGHPV